MVKTLIAAVAVALALAPQAWAKGPIVLCGVSGCASIGTEVSPSVRWWLDAYESHAAPVAPARFFKLQFARNPSVLAYWIPSAGLLRLSPSQTGPTVDGRPVSLSQDVPAVWVRPSPDEIALLTETAATLRPFAAPTRVDDVTVSDRSVPRGASTYLRLFTMGVPVAAPVGAKRWLPIDIWGAETPWTDGLNFMWISKVGSFLKRGDGDVVRIPSRLAERIRQRLPLR